MPPLQLNYFNIFVKQKKNDGATGWQVISSGFFFLMLTLSFLNKTLQKILKNELFQLGAVVHICSCSTWATKA